MTGDGQPLRRRARSAAGSVVDRTRELRRRRPSAVRNGAAAGLLLDGRASAAMLDGGYETSVQQCLQEVVRPGDVVFDVGANEGFFTLLLARLVGPSGRVVAFEPSPANLRRLGRTIELNRQAPHGPTLGRIEVVAAALSDATGRDRLQLTRYRGGPTLLRSGAVPPDVVSSRSVPTWRGDDLVGPSLPVPDVVKVDVEGAELLVLDGLRRTLAGRRPYLVVEVDGPPGPVLRGQWQEVDDLLETLGYATERLAPAYSGSSRWEVGHTLARPATSA